MTEEIPQRDPARYRHTHTLTTPVGDDLRHALALQAGLRPDSVEVVGADLRDGALAVEIAGTEL